MDAGRRVIWNMGAIAARGDDKSLKLFRDILLASSSIPGFFQPVEIEVEANGKKFQEMHLDGTITAPFFIAPEASFGPGGSGLPTKQVYVVVNSKLNVRLRHARAQHGIDPRPHHRRRAGDRDYARNCC